jgi:signal transduction histidine kinase
LGEELISSETVALIELVKNSYDADASFASVVFHESLEKGRGYVEVFDDGHGMSLETVRSAWMEPATIFKRDQKQSPGKSRRVLGEKGVGRFAAARLAEELELVTKTSGQPDEVYAIFDWTQFDREDLYLDQILILAERRAPAEITPARYPAQESSDRAATHGTVLRMNRLKKSWDVKAIDDLRRGLSRLISPFSEDQHFKIYLQLPGTEDKEAQQLEPPEILKYPHYTISGDVASTGKFHLSIEVHSEGTRTDEDGWVRRRDESGKSPLILSSTAAEGGPDVHCGPVSFRILVWDRDQLDNVQQKLGTGLRSIRKDLDAISGISIYRDGFRVLPYGEPNNDWLRLDIRRVQNPSLRLSNNQLTGYIRIGSDTNPDLKDQSNREGLDNNEAFQDLQSIMQLMLSRSESVRFQAKNRVPEKPEAPHESMLETPDVTELRQQLKDKLEPGDETLSLFDAAAKQWERQIASARLSISRYHALATIGQLVDKVVHDARQPLSKIRGQAALASETVDDLTSRSANESWLKAGLEDVAERLGRVSDAAEIIHGVLNRIEPLGGRKRGQPKKVYLEEVIRGAFLLFSGEIEQLAVQVTLPTDELMVTVEPSEIQEVIINLLTNSLYWLREVDSSDRRISVAIQRRDDGSVEIVFADSGPGIPKKDRASIFDPYFTSKPDGVGLGLVIAGEIVRDYYDGTLELLEPVGRSGAVFRIVLRKRIAA